MSRVTYQIVHVVTATALVTLAGCGSGDAEPDGAARTTAVPSAASATSTTTSKPPAGPQSPAVRCTGKPGPARTENVRVGVSTLTGARLGRGDVWAVLLHQTNGDGYCGWWSYANWLADRGVQVLTIDLCGYGDADCTSELADDQQAQVVASVRHARSKGAARVTLVGASMGGAVAAAAARQAKADAVVDLSGPPDWPGTELVRDSRSLTMPVLLAVSPTDASYVPVYRKAIRAVPSARKQLVIAEAGHGYELLGYGTTFRPFATRVLAMVTG